jgi:hypothetical protein
MREQVAAHYPGTRTSLGEYNFGGLESVNGALAQADVLGIFGRERLDAAMLWDPPAPSQPGAYAFRMYRDYDGAGGRFGETSVRATSADQSKLAVYAAQRGADGAVTVMVVNKTAGDLTSTVALDGAAYGAAAQAWSYSAADATAIRRLADVPVTGAGVATTFAASSVTVLVVPAAGTTPPAPAATALSSAVAPSVVTYGSNVTVTGRLTSGAAGVPSRPVVLEAQRKGTSTWTSVGTVTSAADGAVRKVFAPQWSATLRWRFAGDGSYAASASPGRGVTVLGTVTATIAPAAMPLGGTARITGKVSPAHPGGPYAVQQWVSGIGWKTLGTASLSPTSTFSSAKRPGARGVRDYRVVWLGDADHASAPGPGLRLTVS